MVATPAPRPLYCLLLLILCFSLSSCSKLITSTVIEPAVENLQQQTDVDLVCEGAPAYLLMIDSMLVSSPNDEQLLLIATQSYVGYGAALEECVSPEEERVARIADKARRYGLRLLNDYLPVDGNQDMLSFNKHLAALGKSDVPEVFWGTYGWLSWVRSQKGSPQSIADLVLIEKIMARLLELDESYMGGSIHLFFGGYYAARPAMFGGKPEISRMHFERALKLAKRRFLLTQITYAETLARTTMDQALHDQLLNEVLAFPLETAPEFGLSNQIAVRKARTLLDENYFGE
ncbi:MAG: TRAP transporter TatT component family protein [Desulforhopalus sp.]